MTAKPIVPRPAWMFHEGRHCRKVHLDVMFPEGSHEHVTARNVCIPVDGPPCPVLDQCRDYALVEHERFGMWGGLGQNERIAIWNAQRRREEVGAPA